MSGRDTASSSNMYHHQDLDAETKQIRLLCVWPAVRRSAPIECNLEHHSLNKPPPYYALSYTWGDTSERVPILLDGSEFLITRNLESALRQFRGRILPYPLWVDSICINQENHDERTQQVMLMQDIYAKATWVWAWLGAASEDSDRAVKLAVEISRRYNKVGRSSTAEFQKWILSTVSRGFQDCDWTALSRLLLRPWWTRVWIIQEVLFANIIKLHCGARSISLDEVWNLYMAVNENLATIGAYAITDLDLGSETTAHARQVTDDIDKAIASRLCMIPGISADPKSLFGKDPTKPPKDLMDLVLLYRGFQATDPRDKIYALQGLIPDRVDRRTASIPPDYRISVERLYLNLVRDSLHTKKLRRILESCNDPGRRPGLPSWVPDLSTHEFNTFTVISIEYKPENIFKASRDLKARIHIPEESDTLCVDGILVTTIDRMSEVFKVPDSTEDIVRDLEACHLLAIGMERPAATALDKLSSAASFADTFEEGRERSSILDKTLVEKYRNELDQPYVGGFTVQEALLRTLRGINSDQLLNQGDFDIIDTLLKFPKGSF
jgi:hypothetical protein